MRPAAILVAAVGTIACVRTPPPESALRTQYVAADDSPTGHRVPTARFAMAGGPARITPVLPDTTFCHTYFALRDGTYCFRAHANEAFQTRRLNAFSTRGGARADSLLRASLREEYAELRPLLFAYEVAQVQQVSCASFMVNQLLRDLDGATFRNFFDAPAGIRRSGVGCVVEGRPFALVDSFPEIAQLALWDVVRAGRRPLLLFVRYGNENAQLLLFEGVRGQLIRVRTIDLWSL